MRHHVMSEKDLFKKVSNRDVEVDGLTQKLESLNCIIKKQVKELEAVNSEKEAIQKQVSNLGDEAGSLKQKLEMQEKKVKELEVEVDQLIDRLNHIDRKSEDTVKKESLDKVERDVQAVNTTVTTLKDSVEKLDSNQQPKTQGKQLLETGTQKLDNNDQQFAEVDDQMAEKDLCAQVLEPTSYDGTLLWKLRDYTRRKAEAIAGKTLSLYSQPFYTHRYGYKMCAKVYFNGDGMGKGSHLSLSFFVMRGEYDNLLKWPFPCKVTMILLDQETSQSHMSDTFRPDPNSSSFRKPASEMNIASGCPLFISHNVLETRKFIQDDTLFVKVEVDTSNAPYP